MEGAKTANFVDFHKESFIDIYKKLSAIDVKPFIENKPVFSKNKLTGKSEKVSELAYLSWANALKLVQDAGYEVIQHETKKNTEFEMIGTMLTTTVTICGYTKSMSLPVMDNSNHAIPNDEIDARDINDTERRCFVKNLALFGLGISLYTGEINVSEKEKYASSSYKQEQNDIVDIAENVNEVKQPVGDDVINELLLKHNSSYTLQQVKKYYDAKNWSYNGKPISINFVENAIKNKWIK